MKHCPACHRPYDDAVKFCPHDGTVLPGGSDEYVGRRLMQQFDILAQCGEGAMGTVYRARQINMDRLVAIKILRRDLVRDRTVVKRFYREAKAAARLSHPNIITVHLVAETDEGLPYIVMEHLEGTDLDSLCKAEAPLSMARAVHLTAQIAAALSEAHQNDVVHRDLKPANIIVLARARPAEVVKVLDFGIAKILEAGVSDESRITKSGAIFGTPYYLSPEQATGAELDPRADLYSLGVILYRLVTGHLPFESGSGLDILVRHVKDAPPPPRTYNPDIPLALEQVILTALEKDREQRHSTADAMRTALLAAAEEAGLPLSSMTPIPSSPWSAPTLSDSRGDVGKKTVAGFSSGASDGVVGPPPPVDRDPLVLAARRVAWGDKGAVPSKLSGEPRPTVQTRPGAPLGAHGVEGARGERGMHGGHGEHGAQGANGAQGALGAPASGVYAQSGRDGSASGARSPSRGQWTDGQGGDLGGEDLPGVGRQSLAMAAPAPVPKLRMDPLSGRVELPGHRGDEPGAQSSKPLISSHRFVPAGDEAPNLSFVASDSSPSVVTGQHSAPSQSVILAYRRAADRGRLIIIGAVVLAVIALGVGGFFVIKDQRRGRQKPSSSAASAPRSQMTPPDAAADPGGAQDASFPEPASGAGIELLRFSEQGLALRLSSDEPLRQGHEHSLLLDLWVDGRSRPVQDARVTLRLGSAGRRPLSLSAKPAPLAGRYVLDLSFPSTGAWAGAIEVRSPSGQSWKAPLKVTVGPRQPEPPAPRPMVHRRPRPRPRPMAGLPRLPPDDVLPPYPMLPRPPRDPPTPPPDPD